MPSKYYPQHPCPKCGRLLAATAEATVEGEGPFPVYECEAPACVTPFTSDNEQLQVPFTFVVNADGRVVEVPLGD
jgi:hypothetical protein